MKLRIKGNSLRLRLLRSEVETLTSVGFVSEDIRFGMGTNQALRYTLVSSGEVEEVIVQFVENQILLLVPESVTVDWTGSDLVSIETVQKIDADCSLTVLIEKDFVCLDRPDDPDRDDAFPHPAGC
jgi:hypothetical protein